MRDWLGAIGAALSGMTLLPVAGEDYFYTASEPQGGAEDPVRLPAAE